jgi:ankyrin repeat protein
MYTLTITADNRQDLFSAIRDLGAMDDAANPAAFEIPNQSNATPFSAPSIPLAPPPEYDLEQLARAGASFVEKDKERNQPLAQALLTQFNVSSIKELPKERYGEFATALRGLGADI